MNVQRNVVLSLSGFLRIVFFFLFFLPTFRDGLSVPSSGCRWPENRQQVHESMYLYSGGFLVDYTWCLILDHLHFDDWTDKPSRNVGEKKDAA